MLSMRPIRGIWLAHRAFDGGWTGGMSRIADHRATVNAPATGGRGRAASGAHSQDICPFGRMRRPCSRRSWGSPSPISSASCCARAWGPAKRDAGSARTAVAPPSSASASTSTRAAPSSASCAARAAERVPKARTSSRTRSAGRPSGGGCARPRRLRGRVDLANEITIARPPEEVFDYLADIANHAEFSDHFMVDWRLTSEDTYGVGAGARWKSKAPLNRFPWGDSTIVEAERPRRVVVVGRTGKYNRNRTIGVYELERAAGGGTRVRVTYQSEPKLASDRLLERIAGGWSKRKHRKAMRRLQSILEEDYGRGKRPTIAGGPRKPATGSPFRG